MNETSTKAGDTAPPRVGVEVIADVIKRLPNGPGVYRMIDAGGKVLYVGKARSLKKRVQSYTRLANQPGRIARMIMATASMEFVSTRAANSASLCAACFRVGPGAIALTRTRGASDWASIFVASHSATLESW